jgi:hypothetical protein
VTTKPRVGCPKQARDEVDAALRLSSTRRGAEALRNIQRTSFELLTNRKPTIKRRADPYDFRVVNDTQTDRLSSIVTGVRHPAGFGPN